MYLRLLVLSLIAIGSAIHAAQSWVRQSQLTTPGSTALVPREASGWTVAGFWTTPRAPGVWQENGQYNRDDLALTLTYDHFSPLAHDAFDCFKGRGAVLHHSRMTTLRTLGQEARFNLGYFSVTNGVAVVATSSCSATGCDKAPVAPVISDLLTRTFWIEQFVQPAEYRIPLNISIESKSITTSADYPRLEAALIDFVQQLDLEPVKKTTALENSVGAPW